MYSPFLPDSTPKSPPKVNKRWTGLLAKVSNRKRNKQLKTLRAKVVYPPPPSPEELTERRLPATDSLQNQISQDQATEQISQNQVTEQVTEDDSQEVATTLPSITADTSNQATAPRYRYGYDPSDNFNQEQIFYNQLFGHLLLDVEEGAGTDSLAVERALGAEFDEVPAAYVDGEFVDDNPGGLEDFVPEEDEATPEENPTLPAEDEATAEENPTLPAEDEATPEENPTLPEEDEATPEETPPLPAEDEATPEEEPE